MDPNTNNPDPDEQSPPVAVPPSEEPSVSPPQTNVTPGAGPPVPPEPVIPDLDSISSETGPQPQVVVSPDITPDPVAPAASVGAVPTPGIVTAGDFSAPATLSPQLPQPSMPGLPPASPASAPTSRLRSFKKLAIVLAAVLVIGGGSAAAYFGVVVPNKPANVLKTALINSLQQKQVSSSGSFEESTASGSGIAYKGTFNVAEDVDAKAVDTQLNLTVSGISFPVEARLVNQNLYLKVGDLTTIASLVGGYIPGADSLVQSLNGELSNKWIVVDSTILDESGPVKCVLNANWGLTSADIKLLETQYGNHPFTTIQSATGDTVNGKAAEKFVLSIDDDKLSTYGNQLSNLSLVKTLDKCAGSGTTSKTTSSSSDHQKTPLTVWVDKSSKRIVQISAKTTPQDVKKLNITGSLTVGLRYGKVSITAPANATPALQVFAQVQKDIAADPALSSLFNSGSGITGNTTLTQ